MPAKITTSKPTDNQLGEINVVDVQKIINDFDKKLKIESIDPTRNPISKHLYFDISMERLKEIIDPAENKSASNQFFRIYLGVTLPSQLDCLNDKSVENTLSVLLCGVQDNGDGTLTPLLNDGQLILTEGFKDHSTSNINTGKFTTFVANCCVNGGTGGH